MTSYFSTFISGFDTLISELIVEDIKDIKNIKIFDGAVSYETELSIDEIRKIKYFNNSFIILKTFNYGLEASVDVLNKIIEDLIDSKTLFKIPNIPINKFKIFSSLENNLVSVDGKLMYKFVDLLKKETKKEYSSTFADTEFWVLYRREKIGFFLLRITKNKKKLAKGELREELTNLLCRLSKPEKNDVMLDPFCGSGAIPLERAKVCGFKGIFAMDKDKELIDNLKSKVKKDKKLQKSFFVKCCDYFENKFEDNFIDTIITDPPWGIYKDIEDNFYEKLFNESRRILKPNGKLILLTSKKELFLKKINGFILKKSFNILVSGQKAGIFILIKE